MPLETIPPRPIKKILIANRGEIATRILSTCRELGLETYTLYTDTDINHTLHASHALRLASPASYTSIPALLAIVQDHAIDALHPGYGFLSESADLAARMAAVDVAVVGPGARILARTGDKLHARALASECGVPVLPAGDVVDGDADADVVEGRFRGFVERWGLPVMIKAVDGGGGRGIRLVREMRDLGRLVARAVEESPSRRVFAERAAVDGFRHVEVQILGDGTGGVRHLWERECSVQRRYQKIVELAPSLCLDRRVVRPVIEAAVRMAKKVNYASLGTFEFLLNPHTGEFFFLEINPRLQVEHTITESICSTDIVKAQLRLAQGASLDDLGLDGLSQDPLTPPPQHSIQLRVTAEDPEKGYSLSIGKITSFRLPSGVGTRVDTALVHGAPAIISSDFDSVIAKIIVTARTWQDTVRKARRALDDTAIIGVQTNLDILRAIVAHADFEAGACDTQWLEAKHHELLEWSRNMPGRHDPFHGLVREQHSTFSAGAAAGGGSGTMFRKDDAWTIEVTPRGSTGAAPSEPQEPQQRHHLQITKVLKNDFPATFAAEVLYTLPGQKPQPWTMNIQTTSASGAAMSSNHRYGSKSDHTHVIMPLSGKLVEVLVDAGDVVRKDEPVCVIKQMKMEIEVRSHRAGVVTWVTEAEDGEDVAEGMLAAVVDEERAQAKL